MSNNNQDNNDDHWAGGRGGGRSGGPTSLRLCFPLVSWLVIVLQVLKRVMIKSPEVSSP